MFRKSKVGKNICHIDFILHYQRHVENIRLKYTLLEQDGRNGCLDERLLRLCSSARDCCDRNTPQPFTTSESTRNHADKKDVSSSNTLVGNGIQRIPAARSNNPWFQELSSLFGNLSKFVDAEGHPDIIALSAKVAVQSADPRKYCIQVIIRGGLIILIFFVCWIYMAWFNIYHYVCKKLFPKGALFICVWSDDPTRHNHSRLYHRNTNTPPCLWSRRIHQCWRRCR